VLIFCRIPFLLHVFVVALLLHVHRDATHVTDGDLGPVVFTGEARSAVTFILASLDAISALWAHNERLGTVMCSFNMFDQILGQQDTKFARGTLMPTGAVNPPQVQPYSVSVLPVLLYVRLADWTVQEAIGAVLGEICNGDSLVAAGNWHHRRLGLFPVGIGVVISHLAWPAGEVAERNF
jgi:hypothetical protein